MKVKLVQMTEAPTSVMWVAARTCYSAKSPIEMWDTCGEVDIDKKWTLVKKVLSSGHDSIAEHVYFTFVIEGISRACSHQLVRHRAGIVFSQQSQRYVEFKESYDTLVQAFDGNTEQQEQYLKTIAEKYFVDVTSDNYRDYVQALINYLGAVKRGIKPEDARNILPNATKTNITMSLNYRELIHICNLRLCTRAQQEIRNLFKLVVQEVRAKDERLASYLVPKCDVTSTCSEHQCCGRKPQLEEVLEGYYKYKDLEK